MKISMIMLARLTIKHMASYMMPLPRGRKRSEKLTVKLEGPGGFLSLHQGRGSYDSAEGESYN